MNTGNKPMYEWGDINWRKVERVVYKLQKRIYKASLRGDVKTVRRLQKLLVKSWSAKVLAVRRVTQDNMGKKTAGVDGVKSLSPEARMKLVNQMDLGSKVKPARRVKIPKPNGEIRPLGIPTMYDRALQALVKLALEPEWEAVFEPNSYGFRPGRSAHDAITAIFLAIKQRPKYVLDADISKCFDRIDHERLLDKLNTFPKFRRQIRAWLKAGVMEGKKFSATSKGTPQGGVISPLLANIALHGMENEIKSVARGFDMRRKNGGQVSWQTKVGSVSVIRYADDFVVLHKDLAAVQRCKEVLEKWLGDMGLELKPSKTRIAHTLETHKNEEAGFDFLGFNICQKRVGKYNTGRVNGQLLGFKTLVTPSKDSQKKHYQRMCEVIEKHKGSPQRALIAELNPIIRGWCNYFKIGKGCSRVFNRLDYLMYWRLLRWGVKRHQNKGKKFVQGKYFRRVGGSNWRFATPKKKGSNQYVLFKHSSTEIVEKYVKVKGQCSPYDGDVVYWSTRLGAHPEMPKRTASLLKKQKGKCNYCGLAFRDGDVWEVDHVIPRSKGGKDDYENLQLLHRHCHDEKTTMDGSTTGAVSAIPWNYRWENDMLVTY
ncbi:group II intron reverse transcriptase/maturase [Euhalothece natronophila Z-M001]|uniref:Group II intron reverse transcriptase/maturase n=1 Tax=Euhalothece natronophila Z-M001 TaxID=522448 RepID=A0A5B8NQ82_9CHRO|nr:group II intron reverse transcriptase/maturase [Euhalothece natronophila]QDZ41184.1 group II intron reverse transcriptase/maturase [Euhalothece natronophila Z-M001]